MDENFFGYVSEEIGNYLLILNKPWGVGRIWDNLILPIDAFGGDGFGGFLDSLIEIAKKASAHDL